MIEYSKSLLRKNLLYFAITVISLLMMASIALTYYNNKTIVENREVQYKVEEIKTAYDQVGKSVIHAFDIGLRGFAIVKNPQFSRPLDNALVQKDSIIENVEIPLKKLGYNTALFNEFKDSLNSYARYTAHLKTLLVKNNDQEFASIFMQDKGAHVWWMYLEVEKDIDEFLNKIDSEAHSNYTAALYRNQIIQVIIFLIGFPTLLYTAFYTIRNFRLSELLRNAEEERNIMLSEQNELLELKVKERTQEIVDQNEKILRQTEALSLQNKQLSEAQQTIEQQHKEIQSMNQQLQADMSTRTQELHEANKHLLEQNNQLEQFAFIAAHNLRAPLTRILGLANLMKLTDSNDDKELAIEKMVLSTVDLDHVISDLNMILNIRRQTEMLVNVDLNHVFDRVKRVLEKEIESAHAVITHDFHEAEKIFAVAPYVESILYNLLSNALKYRDPARTPFIVAQTRSVGDEIVLSISDNGLGIDLERHKNQLFSLYKRFHLHVEGRGLGLYLVRTQIESMGGKVEIESHPNEGTAFQVFFKKYLT